MPSLYRQDNGEGEISSRAIGDPPKEYSKSMPQEYYTNRAKKSFDDNLKLKSPQDDNNDKHTMFVSSSNESRQPNQNQKSPRENKHKHSISKTYNHQLNAALSQDPHQDQYLKQEASQGRMSSSNLNSKFPIKYQYFSKEKEPNLPIEYQNIPKENGNKHSSNEIYNRQFKPALGQYPRQDQQLKQDVSKGLVSIFPIEYQHISKEDRNKYSNNQINNHQFNPAFDQYIRQDQLLNTKAKEDGAPSSSSESNFPIEYQHISNEYGSKYSRSELNNRQIKPALGQYLRQEQQLEQAVNIGGMLSSSTIAHSQLIKVCIIAFPILVVGLAVSIFAAKVVRAKQMKRNKELRGKTISSLERMPRTPYNSNEQLRDDSVRYRKKVRLEKEKRYDDILRRVRSKPKGLRSDIVQEPNNYAMDGVMETIRLDSIHKRSLHSRKNSPRQNDIISYEDPFVAADLNRSRVGVAKKKRLSVGDFVKQCSTLALFRRKDENGIDQNSDLVEEDGTGCISSHSESGINLQTELRLENEDETRSLSGALSSPGDGSSLDGVDDKNLKVDMKDKHPSLILDDVYPKGSEQELVIDARASEDSKFQSENKNEGSSNLSNEMFEACKP